MYLKANFVWKACNIKEPFGGKDCHPVTNVFLGDDFIWVLRNRKLLFTLWHLNVEMAQGSLCNCLPIHAEASLHTPTAYHRDAANASSAVLTALRKPMPL